MPLIVSKDADIAILFEDRLRALIRDDQRAFRADVLLQILHALSSRSNHVLHASLPWVAGLMSSNDAFLKFKALETFASILTVRNCPQISDISYELPSF